MRLNRWTFFGAITLILVMALSNTASAKTPRKKRRYSKPVTHPVVLWGRTLAESTDQEQRKIAAFKLSQFSLPIYQEEVIRQLTSCMKDPDVHIKVLCAKAMGRAGNASKTASIRKTLLETYKADPSLRDTIVRTFIIRKDSDKSVQETFLEGLKNSSQNDEMLVLLSYFSELGTGLSADPFIQIYKQSGSEKVKRATVQVVSEHGQGQSAVMELLASCAESRESTPLVLTCLSGLQLQAKNDDKRAWAALEKTIQSSDPDVLLATLDVVTVLPPTSNPTITKRLLEIIGESSDSEMVDKAVMALDVCGDHSEPLVTTLFNLMNQKDTEETTKIHITLVLGRQADLFPDKPKEMFENCIKDTTSQSLRTACQLSQKELQTRARNVASQTPAAAPEVKTTPN